MNNQLTKFENGKIIKKENVSEEQLINKLYQYERLGTVGKIKSKFNELEVNDDIWNSQFNMARADAEYLKIQLNDYKERYENIKREFNASVRFREINQGLKEQCRKYKLQLKDKDFLIEVLQEEKSISIPTIRNMAKKLEEKEKEIAEAKLCMSALTDATKRYQNSLALIELEKVKKITENILDKALKNCSINSNYYDELLEKIDEQIKNIKKNSNERL